MSRFGFYERSNDGVPLETGADVERNVIGLKTAVERASDNPSNLATLSVLTACSESINLIMNSELLNSSTPKV